MKNPITWFFDKTNLPNEIDTVATMNVEIKQGEKVGKAWVPCTFETLSYGIDINPSLIKKKTNKKIKDLPLEENFIYHPDTEKVKLAKGEEIQMEEEIERCPHCGQPAIVAEVCATKYRSCPMVTITMSTPASQDLLIPVTYGFGKWHVYDQFILYGILMGATVVAAVITNYTSLLSWILGLGTFGFLGLWSFGKFWRLAHWVKDTKKLGWRKYKEESK